MPVPKGTRKPEYTQDQKTYIVERVCELYESQNATIESCCEQVGIPRTTFSLWCAQFVEFGERYKKAKLTAEENWFENILKPKALRATELLLEEREIEETKTEELAHQGLKTGDSRTITTRTKQQPNATTAIFAMKGAFPEKFKDKVEHSGVIKNELNLDALSLEETLQMVEILKKARGQQ